MGTLGSGGFGKVYEIRKADDTGEYHAALKVISIPATPDEYQYYKDDGYDDKNITAIFKSQMESVASEFALMAKFKGVSNIVSYEDHMVIPHHDQIGWDILIRMELLTPLTKYCNGRSLGLDEVTKLARDICRALELCEKKHIIHRDIKPQNIFVNEFGDFKLGDFGIANTMDHTTRATKIGTYNYIAPEVYMGKPYGKTVDLYSLGLVLFWLLNERRLPFQPLPPAVPAASQNEEAQARRLSGEAIPMPRNGDDRLHAVIRRACAFRAEDRFQSAREMHIALDVVPSGTDAPPPPSPDRACPWCKGEKWENLLDADLITYRRVPCKACGGNGTVSVESDIDQELVALRRTPQYQEADKSCLVCRGFGWLHFESGQLFPCPFCQNEITASPKPPERPQNPHNPKDDRTRGIFDDPTDVQKPGPRPKVFHCPDCGAEVSAENTLCEACKRKHTPPPPPTIVCPQCQGQGTLTFVARRCTKKFMTTHIEEWYYEEYCTLCHGGRRLFSTGAEIQVEQLQEQRRTAALAGIASPDCPVCRGLGKAPFLEFYAANEKPPVRGSIICPRCSGRNLPQGKRPIV